MHDTSREYFYYTFETSINQEKTRETMKVTPRAWLLEAILVPVVNKRLQVGMECLRKRHNWDQVRNR